MEPNINKVSSTVKQLCNSAGLEGKFSNHSLRATYASRMYANNVPEQYTKEVTGHKSDYVRVYKRTPDELRQYTSATISDSSVIKNVAKEQECIPLECDVVLGEVTSLMNEMLDCIEKECNMPKLKCSFAHECSPGTLSLCQMINNISETNIEMRKKLLNKAKNRSIVKSSKKIGKTPASVTIDINLNVNVRKN